MGVVVLGTTPLASGHDGPACGQARAHARRVGGSEPSRKSVPGAPCRRYERQGQHRGDAVVALADPIRAALDGLDPALDDATTFEVGTAFAFEYFARQGVDVAVVEVGTGGRLDATNLLDPLVSVIAPISYDHTPTLGETLAEIAWHKSGILRPGRPGILAPQVDEARLVVE